MKHRITKLISLLLCLILTVGVLPMSVLAAGETDAAVTYKLSVSGGKGGGKYEKNEVVDISVKVPDGAVFDQWTVVTQGVSVSFANKTSAETTLTMPAVDVTIKPTFKYKVTVTNGVVSGGTSVFSEGATVTITANADAGCKFFDKWVVKTGDATLGHFMQKTTTFKMPDGAVEIEAAFKEVHDYDAEGLCKVCKEPRVEAINSIVMQVTKDKPAIGGELYAPVLYSINGKTDEKTMKWIDSSFSKWYASETYSTNSKAYQEYDEKTFGEGLAYNLYVKFTSIDTDKNKAAFSDKCALTLKTPTGTLTGTLFEISNDGKVAEYDFFFDVLKDGETTSTTASTTTSTLPPSKPDTTAKRLYGANRYETAVNISSEGWDNANTVILASGENYPDALAGTVLAKSNYAPILLVNNNSLNAKVLSELQRLGAKKIIILGGKAAVSDKIENNLAKSYAVIRVGGENRNDTAAKIALQVTRKSDVVFLVSNKTYADALSAGAAAALSEAPILYVNPDGSIPIETANAMKALECTKAYVIGGEKAVAGKIETELSSMKITMKRLAGGDRYETAIAVYNQFWQLFTSKDVAIATGKDFPDALAGVALAARNEMPVFLVGDKASKALVDGFAAMNIETLYVFGGEKAVAQSVVNDLT